MTALVLLLLTADFTHSELKVDITLPDGWIYDVGCGPFVSPDARCRIDGKVSTCAATICPERVGVLWLSAPVILPNVDEEKSELLEDEKNISFVTTTSLLDGWVMTWAGPSWTDTLPFRVVRRIDQRVIECRGEATTIAGQLAMIEACKTIRSPRLDPAPAPPAKDASVPRRTTDGR